MIAAAAVLLTACSSNDTFKDVDAQDVPIGFNYNGTEKTTRAELDINWFKVLNTNAFGVYGFKSDAPIFTDERVYCSTTDAAIANCVWSHPTVRFWDKSAADAYDFFAYAPYVEPTGTAPNLTYNPSFDKTTEKFTFSGISLIADIEDDGADKVVAKAVRDIDYEDVKDHKHNDKPTVQFDFHHILSKLSFKVYTEIAKADASPNPVATFTLKRINIDFPQSNEVTDNVDFYASDYETAASRNLPKGVTTYTGTPEKDGDFDGTDASDDDVELVFYCEAGYEVPNSATKPALPATAGSDDVACKTYIVTPVNSTIAEHEFGISVLYDIEYADGTTEEGCKATSTLSYSPAQNSHHVVTIKIDPAQIDFCVESVADWDTETVQPVTVD